MTQAKLAAEAGLSESLIRKLEAGHVPSVKHSTAVRLYEALAPRVGAERAAALASALGIEIAVSAARENDTHRGALFEEFTAALPRDEQRAYWLLNDLLRKVEPHAVLTALEALAKIADVPIEPPVRRVPPPRDSGQVEHVVISPPRRRPDGSVEHIETTYAAPREAPPPAPARKRRA